MASTFDGGLHGGNRMRIRLLRVCRGQTLGACKAPAVVIRLLMRQTFGGCDAAVFVSSPVHEVDVWGGGTKCRRWFLACDRGTVGIGTILLMWTPHMEAALTEARAAIDHEDVPVGAVLIDPDGRVVASNHNRREERNDATAHAEMLVLSAGSQQAGDWRLAGHTLVVTLEPCVMCAGAAVHARLERIVYGATDLKAGAAWSVYNVPQDARLNHRVDLVAGVLEEECSALISEFFEKRR